jgi:hypothetical protein
MLFASNANRYMSPGLGVPEGAWDPWPVCVACVFVFLGSVIIRPFKK